MDEEITDRVEQLSYNDTSTRTLDKFHEIEIQQVFEALINVHTLRIQSGIFFGTVNLAALGAAFSTRTTGIIFLASLLIFAFLMVDVRGRAALFALYMRALELEDAYAPGDISTFLTIFLPGRLLNDIQRMTHIDSREARICEFRRLAARKFGRVSFWLPLGGLFLQIAFGLIMWQVFGWSLF